MATAGEDTLATGERKGLSVVERMFGLEEASWRLTSYYFFKNVSFFSILKLRNYIFLKHTYFMRHSITERVGGDENISSTDNLLTPFVNQEI